MSNPNTNPHRYFVPAGLVSAACCMASVAGAPDVQVFPEEEFHARTIHLAESSVFLLGARPHEQTGAPELFAVDGDGTVLRLVFSGSSWNIETLAASVEPVGPTGMASRPTISIGNVLPEVPRSEIVIQTGMSVSVLSEHEPGQWETHLAADWDGYVGLLWGARAGQINMNQPQDEIFYLYEAVLDFSNGLYLFRDDDDDGDWSETIIYSAEVGMDSAIGDVNPARPGANEIVITTEMGPTYEVTPTPEKAGEWPKRLLWDDFDNSGWRVLIENVLPHQPGNEIVYATRYRNGILLSHEGETGHEMQSIYDGGGELGSSQMSDVAVGDIDPSNAALEIVGVDSSGGVHLVQFDGAEWNGRPIWQASSGGLFAVLIDDFVPTCPGKEILVTGESGEITMLSTHEPVPGDLTHDCRVGVSDLLLLLDAWGPCDDPDHCPADQNDDGTVDVFDLLILLNNWG